MDNDEIRRLAVVGVEAEIKRLDDVLLSLLAVGKEQKKRAAVRLVAASPAANGHTLRKRRKMTKAARLQISQRMKQYWAKKQRAER